MDKAQGIYLDNNATTRCDPRVVDKMLPFFSEIYGNPANGFHSQGRLAAKAVEDAREYIAALIGARPFELYFTAGASESNNLAIRGMAVHASSLRRNKIVTSAIEHKAVLETCKRLQAEGFEVVVLPVSNKGVVSAESIESAVDERTLLISIQLANNEIGTIQPIQDISRIAHQFGVLVHCDAAQAIGKMPVNVDELEVDLLSLSAHKFYGPKGVGALYVRKGSRGLPLEPIIHGGGQEKGLRSGTLNVPGIVGFGEAARIAQEDLASDQVRISQLRDCLEDRVKEHVLGMLINGKSADRLPNTSSLTFPGVEADAMLLNLPDVMLGTGSACASGAISPSHVLEAIGLERRLAYSTVRVSLGRFNTFEEIDLAAEKIIGAWEIMRDK